MQQLFVNFDTNWLFSIIAIIYHAISLIHLSSYHFYVIMLCTVYLKTKKISFRNIQIDNAIKMLRNCHWSTCNKNNNSSLLNCTVPIFRNVQPASRPSLNLCGELNTALLGIANANKIAERLLHCRLFVVCDHVVLCRWLSKTQSHLEIWLLNNSIWTSWCSHFRWPTVTPEGHSRSFVMYHRQNTWYL